MATKKTASYYSKKVTSAKGTYNKYNTIYAKNKKTQASIKSKYESAKTTATKTKLMSQYTKAKKATATAKKKVNKAKVAYSDAKEEQASFKKAQAAEKRKASLELKKKVLTNMQESKPGYWASGRPYVVPVYPGTINSFVFIDNTTESDAAQTDITTNGISPGKNISHYTQNQPITRQIDGKLGGALTSEDPESGIEGLKKQYDMLQRWSQLGTEVEFHGQRTSTSAILTNVSSNFDQPRDNALSVSVSLQDVKWAKSEPVKSSKKTTSGKKKKTSSGEKTAKKGSRSTTKSSAGKYVTIKKGDSYWAYHLKYGTTVAKLRSWNGFPDKSLPVGKKARVK